MSPLRPPGRVRAERNGTRQPPQQAQSAAVRRSTEARPRKREAQRYQAHINPPKPGQAPQAQSAAVPEVVGTSGRPRRRKRGGTWRRTVSNRRRRPQAQSAAVPEVGVRLEQAPQARSAAVPDDVQPYLPERAPQAQSAAVPSLGGKLRPALQAQGAAVPGKHHPIHGAGPASAERSGTIAQVYEVGRLRRRKAQRYRAHPRPASASAAVRAQRSSLLVEAGQRKRRAQRYLKRCAKSAGSAGAKRSGTGHIPAPQARAQRYGHDVRSSFRGRPTQAQGAAVPDARPPRRRKRSGTGRGADNQTAGAEKRQLRRVLTPAPDEDIMALPRPSGRGKSRRDRRPRRYKPRRHPPRAQGPRG